MKKVLVSLPDGIYDLVHDLKGNLGESDSEVVRLMVITFLGEKGYLVFRGPKGEIINKPSKVQKGEP